MNAHPLRILPALLVFATAARAASYPVRHLQPNDALMALTVRVPGMSQDCHVSVNHASDPQTAGLRGALDVTCGTDAIQSKIQAALDAIDVPAPTHRFHVAVLGASRKEGPVPEASPSEVKALNDFKKVMTYRSFVVEAETIMTSDRGASMRLNEKYTLTLMIDQNSSVDDAIDVRGFQLRAVNPQVAPSDYAVLIETSFSIKKGETIVLGTSVSDQQARVVLVTALP
jgi:hypothetical protein